MNRDWTVHGQTPRARPVNGRMRDGRLMSNPEVAPGLVSKVTADKKAVQRALPVPTGGWVVCFAAWRP